MLKNTKAKIKQYLCWTLFCCGHDEPKTILVEKFLFPHYLIKILVICWKPDLKPGVHIHVQCTLCNLHSTAVQLVPYNKYYLNSAAEVCTLNDVHNFCPLIPYFINKKCRFMRFWSLHQYLSTVKSNYLPPLFRLKRHFFVIIGLKTNLKWKLKKRDKPRLMEVNLEFCSIAYRRARANVR